MGTKIKYKDRLKVLFVTSEAAPLAKAGGLGDVSGSLPKYLARDFHMEVRIVLPKYKSIDCDKYKSTEIMRGIRFKTPNGNYEKVSVFKSYLPETIVPIYLLDMPKTFVGDGIYDHNVQGRNPNLPFVYFSMAALELIKAMDWKPDIIHIQDWMMGMIPKWVRTLYKDDPFFANTAVVLTIHNILYQGKIDFADSKKLGLKKTLFKEVARLTKSPQINILGESIYNSDAINTVSPTYARELLTKKFGFGLQRILRQRKKSYTGILNGMDYSNFDPRTNPDTPVKYWIDSLDKKVENKLILQKRFGLTQTADLPLICAVTRLTNQKGLDLIEDVLKELTDMGAQFIILGSGAESIERMFIKAEKEYPKAVAAEMRFDADLAQTIYAGSDMLLMPSRFEPCGLSQIIAMRFGTIPIVRRTGGLADTVRDGYTGFVFNHYDKQAFLWAIRRAVDVYYNQKDHWRKMQIMAMRKDFTWRRSTKKYLWLYKKAINNHKQMMKEKDESKESR